MADGTERKRRQPLSPEEIGRRVLAGARAGGHARRDQGVQKLVAELLLEYEPRTRPRDLAGRVARLAHCSPTWVRRVRKKSGPTGA